MNMNMNEFNENENENENENDERFVIDRIEGLESVNIWLFWWGRRKESTQYLDLEVGCLNNHHQLNVITLL